MSNKINFFKKDIDITKIVGDIKVPQLSENTNLTTGWTITCSGACSTDKKNTGCCKTKSEIETDNIDYSDIIPSNEFRK